MLKGDHHSSFTNRSLSMKHTFQSPLAATAAILLHLFLSMGLFAFTAVSLSGCAAQKQEAGHPQAWEFMTATVAEQLGRPENLAFPSSGVNDVTYLGNNRYQITSFADYANREGGAERTYFYGVVLFRDNAWTVETIKFSR